MKNITANKIILIIARILSVLFAFFLGFFALDVFESKESFWRIVLGLCIHLLPTWIMLIVLWVSWKREWIGAVVCFLLGGAYVVIAWGKFHWMAYLLIAGPLFLLSALYTFSALKKQS